MNMCFKMNVFGTTFPSLATHAWIGLHTVLIPIIQDFCISSEIEHHIVQHRRSNGRSTKQRAHLFNISFPLATFIYEAVFYSAGFKVLSHFEVRLKYHSICTALLHIHYVRLNSSFIDNLICEVLFQLDVLQTICSI